MRKSSGELTVACHDFETRERKGWRKRGTLAMIWSEMSSGKFWMSGGGTELAELTSAAVCSAIDDGNASEREREFW